MMRCMTNEEAILNLKTIFAKYKFSEEESKSILKSFSVLFYNSVGAPLTLGQLCEMEGEKVILYRMKSTEPLEPGTVKRNGDVLGDFGMLAYHELYLETWVAFSYHSCHIKKEEQKAELKDFQKHSELRDEYDYYSAILSSKERCKNEMSGHIEPDYKKFYEYWHDLYGTNLQILGWHLNGEPEDFDRFFDSAVTYMEGNSPTKTFNGKTAEELWLELGDVPMNPETECIEISWLGFPAGTHREDIWHWFEKTFNIAVYDLMYK